MLRMSSAKSPLRGAPSVAGSMRWGVPCTSIMWRALCPGGMHASRSRGTARPAQAFVEGERVSEATHQVALLHEQRMGFSQEHTYIVRLIVGFHAPLPGGKRCAPVVYMRDQQPYCSALCMPGKPKRLTQKTLS